MKKSKEQKIMIEEIKIFKMLIKILMKMTALKVQPLPLPLLQLLFSPLMNTSTSKLEYASNVIHVDIPDQKMNCIAICQLMWEKMPMRKVGQLSGVWNNSFKMKNVSSNVKSVRLVLPQLKRWKSFLGKFSFL